LSGMPVSTGDVQNGEQVPLTPEKS
ncbi:phage minor tail protein G, partial [Escherichia coli]|nr:phage minor tail protein G [Escherichia coli]